MQRDHRQTGRNRQAHPKASSADSRQAVDAVKLDNAAKEMAAVAAVLDFAHRPTAVAADVLLAPNLAVDSYCSPARCMQGVLLLLYDHLVHSTVADDPAEHLYEKKAVKCFAVVVQHYTLARFDGVEAVETAPLAEHGADAAEWLSGPPSVDVPLDAHSTLRKFPNFGDGSLPKHWSIQKAVIPVKCAINSTSPNVIQRCRNLHILPHAIYVPVRLRCPVTDT